MKTYTQDRRAYEDWSDGNYNLANRLMGEINKQAPIACPICGKVEHMSADHIGPISLGFCHSMHFAPMCKTCNSSKNNRFTKNDVDELLSKEKSGEQVVSWHSIEIWNLVKNDIRNDADAKLASSIMAKNHQNVLNILSLIYLKTGTEFLMRYLHPEYSLIDYRFENVDLNNLSKITILASPLDSKNKRKNQERYVRIAFESLEEFSNKKNRKNYLLIDENSEELQPIINEIIRGNYDDADEKLKELIKNISHEIYNREKSENGYLDLFENEYSMVAEP
jgi:Alw26I/Eco31I/Esp3I family type II restriction endonuclease